MWQRLLIGDGPWSFLVEAVWRAAIIYLLLLFFMRLMGKRVAAQLTTNEMAVILMLGAAIGVPIQVSSQGVLPAVVVLATTLACQRGLSWFSSRNTRIETVSQGDVEVLVQDGRMRLDRLAKTRLSREMLASELRTRQIQHLGELRRVYIEASGGLSLIPYRDPQPGLSLCPDADDAFCKLVHVQGYSACWGCGNVRHAASEPIGECEHCGCERWLTAVRKQIRQT